MSERNTGKTVLAALGVMAVIVAIAFAQAGGGPGNFGGSPGMGGRYGGGGMQNDEMSGLVRLLQRLDLTESQEQEIRSIIEDARYRIQSVVQESGGVRIRQELMVLFMREDITISEVKAVLDEVDQVQDDIMDIMAEAFVDVHDVLSAEQLSEMNELIEAHSSMQHQMMSPR